MTTMAIATLLVIFCYNSIYLVTPLLTLMLMYFMMHPPETLTTMNKYILMDKLSFVMIMLSIISTMLIILSSSVFMEISLMTTLILMALITTFLSANLLLFYILFEIVLIPTLLLITKGGNQPERLQAGIYLILYTITASLPLLVGIMFAKNSLNLPFSWNSNLMLSYPIMFIMAFLVKMPMFTFHLWLPKAHVEAPVEGSMILAAVLLKLGGYGMIRIFPILSNIKTLSPWMMSISLMGASMTSMNCMRQKDMKSLIAYSSVAHMGLITASLFTMSFIGISGAIIMMIAHGLSSSALFLLVNLTYSKFHTRNMTSLSGLTKMFPNMAFWWFIFLAINISAPPSINLMSELFMLTSMVFWQPWIVMLLFMLVSFMTSVFSINMFINMNHNKPEMLITEECPSKFFLSLFTHFLPLILISLKLEML